MNGRTKLDVSASFSRGMVEVRIQTPGDPGPPLYENPRELYLTLTPEEAQKCATQLQQAAAAVKETT